MVAVDRVLADNTLLGVPPSIAVHLHPDQLDSIAQADRPMGGESLAALNLLRAQVNPAHPLLRMVPGQPRYFRQ